MQNFVFKNPTEIIFGRGSIKNISSRVPADATVLFLYGGGSIKKNGVYQQVFSALGGRTIVEFGGIEANPHYETCLEALKLVKEKKVDFILAVGGGSVVDAGKFIGAAARFGGSDPWEILTSCGSVVKSALPLGVVLTLPATGSESNGNSVVSRDATKEKLFFGSEYSFPVFSVLDPEVTFSLPSRQVRNGIVDAYVHVMEQYMTFPAAAPLQDRFAESILQTLIDVGPVTLAKLDDYDSRASFMWSATLALNNLISCGVPQDWSTHMIGHELTAFYGLAHAETLAIVMPEVWKFKLAFKKAKLEQYGHRIWKVKSATGAITKTETFFQSLGMPTHLKDYKIDADEAAEKVRARFAERGVHLGEHGDIGPNEAAAILRMCA